MVELDGQEKSVRGETRALEKLVRGTAVRFCGARLRATHECEQLWELRREFSFSLRDTGLVKLNQDIVVPRSRLEDLFAFTARLAEEVRPAHRLFRPRRRRQHSRQCHV